MSTKKSTGLCDKLLGGAGGDTLQNIFALGQVMIYGGTVPGAADDATGEGVTSTLLCTVKNYNGGSPIGITFDDSVGGTIAKAVAETWSGVNVAAGTAAFFRLVAVGDDGTLSTTQPRLQGTVIAGGPDAMVLGNLSLSSGATFPLPYFTVTLQPT